MATDRDQEALVTSESQVPSGRRDAPILISHVGPDLMWAEWVSEQLQRAGCSVDVAQWAEGPDGDLLNMLRNAVERYSQCVVVMSSSYLQAVVHGTEAGEAFATWAVEHPGAVMPVLVRRCELPSRFWQLSPVDLREVTDDRTASRRLLHGVLGSHAPAIRSGETEPMTRFPGRRPLVWSPHMPRRNPYFTGRDEMLRELRRRLTTDVTALLPHSLQGLSGVGKTQLAIEYAYRFGADYDIVWWIPSDVRATARQSFADLAIRLDLGGQGTPTGELIRMALDALRTAQQPYQRWLLVFDNAGTPDDIRPLLLSGPGDTIITSRDHAWESEADVLDVDVYVRAESTKFLQRRMRGLRPAEAGRLAEELGDLPLALEHAAGWLSTTQMTTDDYLSLLRERTAELFDPARPRDYPAAVGATWIISMNQLREQNPNAERLLHLCAFIGPNPIPLRLLTDAQSQALPAGLREVLTSPLQRAGILRDIARYSLARVGEVDEGPFGGSSLQQHRLVQAVVRDVVSASERENYRQTVHQLLAAADPGDPERPETWPTYAALLPHLLSSGAVSNTALDVRRLTIHEARALWRRGEFLTCLNLVNEAAEAWSSSLGETDPDLLAAAHERSNAMHGLGLFTEALEADQTVYDRLVSHLGHDHPDTLQAASRVARGFRTMGNYPRAQELDGHALTVSIRDHGRDNPETLRLAHNVAVNHRLAGEFAAALDIDRYNAQAYATILGQDAFVSMFATNNVARDLRECGQYYEALSMQEATYSHYRELFGPDNPETLRAMKNLAVTRRKAGRYAEAAELAEDVLERHHRKFGDSHPETLAATTNFANDHRCLGQYLIGRGFAEIALRGYHKVFGDDHAFTSCAAVNLAALIRLTGDAPQARQVNEDTLKRLRAAFGPNHRYVLTCAVNLASDLAGIGDLEAARGLDEQTLAGLREVAGEDHPYTLSCALNLALDLRALGEREAAGEMFASIMKRYDRTLGSSHPETSAAAAHLRASCDIEPPPV